MSKILEIHSCVHCMWRDQSYRMDRLFCKHPDRGDKKKDDNEIMYVTPIPPWCPLPDHPDTVLPLPKSTPQEMGGPDA